jgi:addiction module HigA family antidote
VSGLDSLLGLFVTQTQSENRHHRDTEEQRKALGVQVLSYSMPMKNPLHPGDFIRTEIIEPAGLTVTAAAAALQVSRPALSNGKGDLSGDMALRIEKAFGVKMDTLMRMQSAHDIAQTRKCEKLIRVRRIERLADVHV